MSDRTDSLPSLVEEEIVTRTMGRRAFLKRTGTLVAGAVVLAGASACSDATDVNTTDTADADAGTTDTGDTDTTDTADTDAGSTDEGDTDLNTTD